MSSNNFRIDMCSDVGRVCTENEDKVFLYSDSITDCENGVSSLAPPFLIGICDGMGGESHGATASGIAAAYAGFLFKELKNTSGTDEINLAVEKYVEKVNDRIIDKLNEYSARGGTTFVIAYVDTNNKVYSFSLGDSRMYAWNGLVLRQVSEDHTVAMKKYRMNIYTKEEAKKSPDSHKLTLFLGADTQRMGMKPEIYPPFTINKGEKIMLCSDGVYDMCDLGEITNIISSEDNDTAKELVFAALKNGGADNVSCIVAGL